MRRLERVARRLVELALAWLPQMDRASWLVLALPLALCLSFMISAGPELQRALFTSLGSSAPNIYSALNDESIRGFWTALQWLAAGLHWANLLIAFTIVLIALRTASLRSAVFLVGVACFICLTLTDLVIGAFQRSSIAEHLTNITANLAGSIVVALLTGIGLACYIALLRAVDHNRRLALSLAAGALVLNGLLVSLFVYSSLRLIYEPLPVRVSFVITPPVGGYFVPARSYDENAQRLPAFSLVPPQSVNGEVLARAVDGTLNAEWSASNVASNFRTELRLFQGCSLHALGDLPPSEPTSQALGARALSFEISDGQSMLTVPVGLRTIEMPSDVAHYNLYLDDTGELLTVSRFTSPDDVLRVSTQDVVHILISAPLMQPQGDTVVSAPRDLTIQLDDAIWRMRFVPPSQIDPERVIGCRPLASSTTDGSSIPVDEIAFTALISLTPVGGEYLGASSTATISELDGWIWVRQLRVEDLDRSGGGTLSGISAEQNVSALEVDGRQVTMGPYDGLWVFGDLLAGYGRGGQIAVNGTASAAWKNGIRLNPTRWERADEWRAPILAALFAAVAAMVALARLHWNWIRKIGSEDPKSWASEALED